MNFYDLLFYGKLLGSGRCPRADVAAIFNIDAFLASVSMGGTAAEVVETESE